MMEFTLARISAVICGAMILLILFNPTVDIFEENNESAIESACDEIKTMFDSFASSDTDELILHLNILLPGTGSTITFDDNTVMMTIDDGTYTRLIKNGISADKVTYTQNDTLMVLKGEGGLIISSI